ncbi:MAG: hypothetical protein UW76_C0020G0006 [Parcubacteria group bacterium GW2011_GWF2_44_8b]|nr:MAG: hypothetical protein UV94_C0011G0006 [Parcubacteria group bacterium GW2011_GWC1_43_30]KKT79751.1 MAG: hypothetical protein UW76_C0020G0006 [Parcubacteria group bacterium GW2011_GWF2_44_8b]KKT84738.1 MAG: hypothetical protein UW83_C0037G0006 [Parcubacteria group bacterium GW2011_GWD1_44_9]
MTKYKIFKIKKGKREIWEKWCKEIVMRQEEAIKTLVEEDLINEKCIIFGKGDNSYVFYKHETISNREKKPMNLSREINRKHKEMLVECLEEVDDKVVGYDIEVK